MNPAVLTEIEIRLRLGSATAEDLAAIASEARDVSCAGALLLADAIAEALRARERDPAGAAASLSRHLPGAQARLASLVDTAQGGLSDVVPVGAINDLRCVLRAPMLSESPFFPLPASASLVATGAPGEAHSEHLVATARSLRPRFQLGMLAWLRDERDEHGLVLVETVLGRMDEVAASGAEHALWRLAHGFAAALKVGGVRPGPAVTRLLGQVDRHLKRLADADPSREPMPEPLLRNLLFYVEFAGRGGELLERMHGEFELGEVFSTPTADELVERARVLRPELSNVLAGVAIALEAPAPTPFVEQGAAVLRAADAFALLGRADLHTSCRLLAAELADAEADAAALAERLHRLAAEVADDEMVEPATGSAVAPGVDLSGMRALLDRLDGVDPAPPHDEPEPAPAPRAPGEAFRPGLLPGVDIEALARRTEGLAEPAPAQPDHDPEEQPETAPSNDESGVPAPAALAEDAPDREELLEGLADAAGGIAETQAELERHLTHIQAALIGMEGELDGLRARIERRAAADGEGAEDLLDAVDSVRRARDGLEGVTDESIVALVRQSRDAVRLQRRLLRGRLVPIGESGRRIEASLASSVARHGKRVSLELTGVETLVDPSRIDVVASVLEQLFEVLVELGVEMPAVREFRRKDPVARLDVRFFQRGASLRVAIGYDGEPLPRPRLAAAESLLAELGGGLEVNERDRAARIALDLPLAPRLASLLLVNVGDEPIALSVDGLVAVVGADAVAVEEANHLHDGDDYPVAELAALLGFDPPEFAGGGRRGPLVLVRDGDARAALVCTGVRGRAESVARALPPLITVNEAVIAATVGPGGEPMLILDSRALARRAAG